MIKPGRLRGRAGDLSIGGPGKAPCDGHQEHRTSTGMWANGGAQAQITSSYWTHTKTQVSGSTPCSRWPCSGRGVGLDDPQRSLPTPNILWFTGLWWTHKPSWEDHSTHGSVLPSHPSKPAKAETRLRAVPWYLWSTKAMLLWSQSHLHLWLPKIPHANRLQGSFWLGLYLLHQPFHAECRNPRSAAAQHSHSPFSGTIIINTLSFSLTPHPSKRVQLWAIYARVNRRPVFIARIRTWFI